MTYIPRYCQVEDQGSGLWVLIQLSLKFGLWTICFDTAVTWMSIVTYGPGYDIAVSKLHSIGFDAKFSQE